MIHGTADKTVNPSNGPAVRSLIGGTLGTVQGVGHTGTSDQCIDAYVAHLTTFYADAVSGRAFVLNPSC